MKLFKKILASIALIAVIASPLSANASLWEYYKGNMPSLSQRATMAYQAGVVTDPSLYTGSYAQNVSLLAALQGYQLTPITSDFGIGIPKVIALFEDSLQNRISSTATSLTLVRGTDKQLNNLSGTYGFTLDEGTATEEVVQCTCTGTACTACLRGISVSDGKTEVTALKFEHRRGASVKATNYPILTILARILNGDESIPNMLYYGAQPDFTSATTTAIITKKYVDDTSTSGAPNADETTKGISELATSAEAAAGTSIGGTGARLVLPSSLSTSTPDGTSYYGGKVLVSESDGHINQKWLDLTENYTWSGNQTFTGTSTFSNGVVSNRFGGTGLDGALSVTAGTTTTLNFAGASLVTKNYTSINIPNTAGLTFSNASTTGSLLYLKSQGDCTIGGNIWGKGGGATSTSPLFMVLDTATHDGGDGAPNVNDTPAVGGAVGSVFNANLFFYTTVEDSRIIRRSINVVPGANGGDGGNSPAGGQYQGGQGGRGGMAVVLECGGYLSFTGSIDVSGANGTNGTNVSGNDRGGPGGGGGGAGGQVLVLYNFLTTNTGVINTRGGNGGIGGNGAVADTSATGGGGGGGAGAGCYTSAGIIGGAGGGGGGSAANGVAGGNSSTCAGAAGGGGGGDNNHTGGAGGTSTATDPNNYKVLQNFLFF